MVCPGGGYSILASEHEGTEVCEWLNGIGVDGVLLKYRVPRRKDLAKHHAPLQDAQRAMGHDPQPGGGVEHRSGEDRGARVLRRRAPCGDDAGLPGADLSARSRRWTAKDCRPDFGILIYPAYQLDEEDPDKLAPELKFHAKSPPVFIAVASDDKWASSSARLYLELQRLKVPVEMHAFAKGGHGFGITKQMDMPLGQWPQLCAEWMRRWRSCRRGSEGAGTRCGGDRPPAGMPPARSGTSAPAGVYPGAVSSSTLSRMGRSTGSRWTSGRRPGSRDRAVRRLAAAVLCLPRSTSQRARW